MTEPNVRPRKSAERDAAAAGEAAAAERQALDEGQRMAHDPARSYRHIEPADLQRLAALARTDRKEFFNRNPRWAGLYGDKLLCVALCQGAGLHFVDGSNGVKDFDVWSFFRRHPDQSLPRRPVVARDFGDPKFGRSPDRPHFVGRRVDLLLKSIEGTPDDPIAMLRGYLSRSSAQTARCLAQKAVVLIEPEPLLGVVAWPMDKLPSLSSTADAK